MSSKFKVFEPETHLLTDMTKLFQLSINQHKIKRALTLLSKFTLTNQSLPLRRTEQEQQQARVW
jgi:hypothetical protein